MVAERASAESKLLREVSRDLQELQTLKLSALQAHYQRLFGESTYSKNAAFLRKKLARRIQELAEGGLSERALARIRELGPEDLPAPREKRATSPRKPKKGTNVVPPVPQMPSPSRDPRLPAVGSVLRRGFQGLTHEVTILEEGFFWNGCSHKSLSAIARAISGTAWNGFLFFGLASKVTP